MARIRTIKPEFPQSESMGRVSREARYCFILLWTIADDEGRLRGSSRMLASLLYPYDDDAPKKIDGWLNELDREGCIIRYEADGNAYIQICKWLIHQKIDRPSKSKIPAFDESSRILASPRRALDDGSGPGPGSKDQGVDQGREGKGRDQDVALRARREQVSAVFDCWRQTMGHQKSVLDDKRRKIIEARLSDGYPPESLCKAIRGCSKSPFHMGMNDRGARYDGLDLILRDGAKVDQFIGYDENPPRPQGKQAHIESINRSVVDEFVNGPGSFSTGNDYEGEVCHA